MTDSCKHIFWYIIEREKMILMKNRRKFVVVRKETFLKKKRNRDFFSKDMQIDVLGSMAMGLFASLLIGTILNTIGTKLHINFLSKR